MPFCPSRLTIVPEGPGALCLLPFLVGPLAHNDRERVGLRFRLPRGRRWLLRCCCPGKPLPVSLGHFLQLAPQQLFNYLFFVIVVVTDKNMFFVRGDIVCNSSGPSSALNLISGAFVVGILIFGIVGAGIRRRCGYFGSFSGFKSHSSSEGEGLILAQCGV